VLKCFKVNNILLPTLLCVGYTECIIDNVNSDHFSFASCVLNFKEKRGEYVKGFSSYLCINIVSNIEVGGFVVKDVRSFNIIK